MNDDLIRRLKIAVENNTYAEVRPSEMRWLRENFAAERRSWHPFSGAVGSLTGIPLVVTNPKGYPVKVTPRARKKKRRP